MRLTQTTTLIAAAACTFLLASMAASASNIYKYTDENGTVHYVDRPTGAPTEERVAIVTRPTDRGAVQSRIESRLNRQLDADEARQARDEERKSEADQRAEAAQRAKRCEEYRSRLESYVQARRLYREDENGERVYLDDSQRNEARQKLEELVAETCN